MLGKTPGLEDMHDIVVPDPVTWWPPAPGWYVLLLVILVLCTLLLIRSIRQYRKNQFRREALQEIEQIPARDLPALVKRVALHLAPRDQVASLSGEAWLHFLDQTDDSQAFSQGPGRLLLELSYNPSASIQQDHPDYQQLLNTITHWIKHSTTK